MSQQTEKEKKILLALTEREFYTVCGCVTWRRVNKDKQITRKRNNAIYEDGGGPKLWEIRERDKLSELEDKFLNMIRELP